MTKKSSDLQGPHRGVPRGGVYSNREEYRRVTAPDLLKFRVQHRETELLVCAESVLYGPALGAVLSLRKTIEEYICSNPEFLESLVPLRAAAKAPDVIKKMCKAARLAGVGPMAAVAGAFSEHVGCELLKYSRRVIVENGGDIFMKTGELSTVAVYAGKSPFSMKLGIEVDSREIPVSVCTSSGTVGPSLSFGKADAAVVVSSDAYLADACATRLGNELKTPEDIEKALETVSAIEGVVGAVAVMGEKCGAVGDIRLIRL